MGCSGTRTAFPSVLTAATTKQLPASTPPSRRQEENSTDGHRKQSRRRPTWCCTARSAARNTSTNRTGLTIRILVRYDQPMENKVLTLLRTERRDSRLTNLYRCCCGQEQWVRADKPTTRLRKCGCPPRPYTAATKVCTKCKTDQPVESFFLDKRTNNPRPTCKTCSREQTEDWKNRNPQTHINGSRRRNKVRHAKNRFGMTPEQYQARLAEGGNLCGICSKPEPQSRRKGALSLDHCHATGKIRGALCSRCNTMLGYANDDTELLRNAIRYLAKHQ